MGRKRKPGPKRRSRKTGGIVKGSRHVTEQKRGAIVQLRDAGHSGSKISALLGVPKSTVNRIIGEVLQSETVPLPSRAASSMTIKLWCGGASPPMGWVNLCLLME